MTITIITISILQLVMVSYLLYYEKLFLFFKQLKRKCSKYTNKVFIIHGYENRKRKNQNRNNN